MLYKFKRLSMINHHRAARLCPEAISPLWNYDMKTRKHGSRGDLVTFFHPPEPSKSFWIPHKYLNNDNFQLFTVMSATQVLINNHFTHKFFNASGNVTSCNKLREKNYEFAGFCFKLFFIFDETVFEC